MMKLVISFDEIGLDNGFSDFDSNRADIALLQFLEDQFPYWDMGMTFSKPPEYDFDNMEITLQMEII